MSSARSASAKKKCCFCVYPMPGTRDASIFEGMCQECLPVKFPGCDVYDTFPETDFMPDYIDKLNCSEPVNTLNIQHGPNVQQAINIFAVCQQAYPGCSVRMLDGSCETFEKLEDAQAAVEYLTALMPTNSRLEICGSGSVNVWQGCRNIRIVKKFVISPSFTEERLGLCPPFGAECHLKGDGGQSFKCLDTLGRQQEIPCCLVSHGTKGYWGGSHGCAGRGCDKTRCPTRQRCSGDVAEWQYCSEETPTGVCIKGSSDCWAFNKKCTMVNNFASCFAVPTRTPTALPSAASK